MVNNFINLGAKVLIEEKGKEQMKVSIITVVYNGNAYIKDCINSVLSQDYKDIEYIIIDGGSIDGTVDVINSYGNRISKFISEKDSGIYDAMNKGLRLATGDIVGVLNSDDLYVDCRVIKTVANSFKNNNIDATYSDLVYVKRDDVSKVTRRWKAGFYTAGLFRKGWHLAHPTFFVKKAVYDKYGEYNTNLKIASDYEMMLRLLEKNKIKILYIDKVLVKMRQGGASNKSVFNILTANKECYSAWKLNNLKVSAFFIIKKLIWKISQLTFFF